MRKTKLSKLISFLLCFTMVVTGIVTTPVVSNADNAESKVGQTGIAYKGSFVYKEANIDSEKAELSGYLSVDGSYQFTIIEELNVDGQTWYKYECDGLSMAATYPYVKKEDVTFTNEEVVLEGEVAGIKVSVAGNIPKDVRLSLADVDEATLDLVEYDIDNISDILTALDIKLVKENGTEWQPTETVRVSIYTETLGLGEGDVVTIKHNHDGEISSLGLFAVNDGKIQFDTDAFSIYVVTGGTGENHYNYKISMVVGDSLDVTSTTTGNSYQYSWSLESGDTGSFSLSNNNSATAKIRANAEGEAVLKCVITRDGYTVATETITVVSLASVGNSINDDIIFANVRKSIDANDDEYTNTYGPYTMKVRFEDSSGKLIDMGEDYYVFDSVTNIDINTFATAAPDGYTYAGAFFYWTAHNDFNGPKVYVTSVERRASLNYGSYLWYGGTHDSSGAGAWAYQASGVLHVVYAPVEEVHSVVFRDHCSYELADYALKHNDNVGGVKFPTGYVDNIDNMANNLIPNHHSQHDIGCNFSNYWVVTGGGTEIDGTYTTTQLKNKITKWEIVSDITITAQCSEPDVVINYVPTPNFGGEVSVATETVKAGSGVVQGSTATANPGYEFKGWYSDENCTVKVSDDITYKPAKVNRLNVAATYYAKFEYALADLTIKKSGINETIDANQTVLFKVEGTDENTSDIEMMVTVAGNGTVVIKDLPIGEYTVTEDMSWTSRYTNASNVRTGVKLTASGVTVEFNNTRSKDKWLDFNDSVDNIFKSNGIERNESN